MTREEVFTCENDNGNMGLAIFLENIKWGQAEYLMTTFPSRPCEIPPTQAKAKSLAALTSDDNSSTSLISCNSSTCKSWQNGETSWVPFSSFDDRSGHMLYAYKEELLVIGGNWENEYTSSSGIRLPSLRVFNLGNPAFEYTSRASESSCLISNGDSFVLVGLRNQRFPGYDFVEEYSSTGEHLRGLRYFDSNLHRNFPACGTFQDDQGETAFLTISALSSEIHPFSAFVLYNGALDWVVGPQLPQRDDAGLIGRNLGLGQLIIAISDQFTQQDVFQLTPDGKSWMSLGQFDGVNFDVAVADLSLLCD